MGYPGRSIPSAKLDKTILEQCAKFCAACF